jgi:hypothetical protein
MKVASIEDPQTRRDLFRAISRRRSRSRLVDPQRSTPRSEAAVQAAIVEDLRQCGYEVLETSERRKRERCPHCREYFIPRKGRGTTPGVPDLLVTRETFAPGWFIGIEVKGPRTAIRPAQRDLARRRRIFIVRSVPEALRAVACALAAKETRSNT